MSEYKYTEHDYVITCDNGSGNLIINANVEVHGTISYSNVVSTNSAFLMVGAQNPGPPNGFSDLGMLVQTSSGPNTYAGLRYDIPTSSWQVSTGVNVTGAALPATPYYSLLTTNSNLASPNIGNATGISLTLSGNLIANNVLANTDIFAGNSLYASSDITVGGNVVGTAGTFATVTANNITSTGPISATGQLVGAGVAVTGIVSSGTGILTSGYVSGNTLSASGNIFSNNNISAIGNVTALAYYGDGGYLSNINVANVIGAYGNANVSNFLSNFGSNAVSTTGNINAGYFIGDGGLLSNINVSNIFGTYGNANVAGFLGNLGSNSISTGGNVVAGNLIGDGSNVYNISWDNIINGNAVFATFLPTYNGNLGNVGISNSEGILMGSPLQGNLVSNAVSLTTTTPVPDSIALLNAVLGKLVPSQPPAFPGTQTLTLSSLTTHRMANIVQVDNTGNSRSVAPGTVVTSVLRTPSYSTNTIANVGPGNQGTITSFLNGNVSGNTVLTGNSNGTYGNLIISANQDYNLSNSSIPAGFWYVFSSRLSGTAKAGWNDAVIVDTAAGNTNVPSWYYDTSNGGTPSFITNLFSVGTTSTIYSSTVPNYTSSTQWTIGFHVGNVSGNMYPVSNAFVLGSAGGAFQAPDNVNYNQSTLASNIIPAFASADVLTIANIVTGFGSSSTGPSVTVTNSYNSATNTFSPGAIINYKTGTTGSLTFLEETNLFVGGTIGAGVVGNVYRIVNPGSTDTPPYSGTEPFFNSQIGPFYTYDAAVVANRLSCNQTNYSTGYLPVGPDLSGQGTTQYFTFKFIAPSTSKFDIYFSGTLAGLFVALPGSGIDTSSTLNGWMNMNIVYAGSGQPGAGTGGNGSNGCALGTPTPLNTLVTAQRYTCTFGTASTSGSTNNEVYVRIKLVTGQTITSLAIYPASN